MPGADWRELAEGVFYKRFAPVNVNVGVVLGKNGALVVDTRASPVQAAEVATELTAITSLPVIWVVNTHYHWDHTFGNQTFRGAALWGHPACRRFLIEEGETAKRDAMTWDPSLREELADLEIVAPDHLVDPSATVDLGGRSVSLEYLGRAHTDSDIVVRVSDSPVVFAGDVFESGAPPWFGDGFPVAWSRTAQGVMQAEDRVIVPGHGPVMGPGEATTQLQELADVADLCRRAHAGGERRVVGGPYPEPTMREALRRGLLELASG